MGWGSIGGRLSGLRAGSARPGAAAGAVPSRNNSSRQHAAPGPPELDHPSAPVDVRQGNGHIDLSALEADDVIDLADHREDPAVETWTCEPDLKIAVLIPCHNEAPTIAGVVNDFRRALPSAEIYVYDNASTDGTAEISAAAGAIVRRVSRLGKGNVLRCMFAEVEATVYVLIDGDGTYDVSDARRLIERLRCGNLEMAVGRRIEIDDTGVAYRRGHKLGNRLLTTTVHWLFGAGSEDMLSGYRAFSRRYVKSFPATSRGFEAETEMTIHALDLCVAFEDVPVSYGERPGTSKSKLRTIPDGLRILRFILLLCKDYRPLRFFGALTALCLLGALAAGPARELLPAWAAIPGLGLALICLAALFLVAGVVIDSISRSRREVKRILFLAIPQVTAAARSAARSTGVDGMVG